MGDMVTSCPACGTVHHTACWTRNGGCGTYACAPARRESMPADGGVMRVTVDDIQRAPAKLIYVAEHGAQLSKIAWASEKDVGRTWSRLCIASLIIAMVSIPALALAAVAESLQLGATVGWIVALLGLFPGWIAVLLGVIGLVLRKPRQRGIGLAAGGVLIGIACSIGSALVHFGGLDHPAGSQVLSFDKYELDPDSLKDLPEKIARPMRSNVLISTSSGLGGLAQSVGSGVVVKIAPGSVMILTNRHVIDAKFHGSGGAEDPLPTNDCTVKFIGHPTMKGNVVWIAPYGVDAALLQVAVTDMKNIVAACWNAAGNSHVSERVFVIGNPMGLGWSHASGEISANRRQEFGPLELNVIQTSAPVNHGNSGGGLYDDDGMLLGINTWTQDKRMSEGLGFSISFHAILDLIPKKFDLPAAQKP